jgi:TolB-like protein
MLGDIPAAAPGPRPTLFLSYATQDRPAARALQQAIAAFGLEVWLDESELGGGEAWDQKIRKQIRDCDYFMPVVSAQTEARPEGYFRREWRLAVERTLDMADDHLFLLPVVIDGTDQAKARVPEKFLAVQWLKVPGGASTPGLEALCRRIAAGPGSEPLPKRPPAPSQPKSTAKPLPQYPAFPNHGPTEKLPYWVEVIAWAGQTVRTGFLRLPRWVRLVSYVWVGIAVLSRCDGDKPDVADKLDKIDQVDISPDKIEKIKSIAQQYQGSSNKADIAKLGAQIAREIVTVKVDGAAQANPLLAIPFVAPAGDTAAAKFADSAFAMVYGRIAVSRHGHVALSPDTLATAGLDAALAQGHAHDAAYVLFGAIKNAGDNPALEVTVAGLEKGAILWSRSYPVASSNPDAIAAEVDSKIPSLDN